MTRFLSLLLFISLFFGCQQQEKNIPQPTEGTQLHQGTDDEGNANAREAWFELMHSHAPTTSWQQIEYQNAMDHHLKKQQAATTRSNGEILANGALTGRWIEKGNNNQAGSVYETIYDVDTDKIYTVSAGGALWRGNRDGSDWEVVNQDFIFSRWLLELITLPDGTKRMLALINRAPHYSDDGGITWTASEGITATDNWGGPKNTVVLKEMDNQIFCLSKPSFFVNYALYRSIDHGVSFEKIVQFPFNSSDRYAMSTPANGNAPYVVEKNNAQYATLYKWQTDTESFDTLAITDQIDFDNQRANLAGHRSANETRLYTYGRDNTVKMSTDEGQTWSEQGSMNDSPWAVGFYVSPSNPDFLMTGGLNCYKSYNAGVTWQLQNEWWEYYDDVPGKLHADIMSFNEFTDINGNTFQLISNHGGLSISYDNLATTQNIGRLGLNVNQFYDVRTDPLNPIYIYAGSQDQGFQRGIDFVDDNIIGMEQVISGDYGHLAFSENNQRLWTVYPGGDIYYYNQPQTGYSTAYYSLQSDNETVWITPTMESPNTSANEIYLAGGNSNGGSGSYIIKLEENNGVITPTNLPFNFLPDAGGEVSAMRFSPLNPNRWYVGTTNGRFFTSEDAGQTWEQTLNFLPDGHYLYGQAILPSSQNPDRVYYAGSGYDNPPVFVSNDNGASFENISNGLPSTLVFELVANPDESLIFAATEAGPFVYVAEENEWFDMRGEDAPTQTYWSVEYLAATETIRFGTYGRGIWDFKIEEVTSTNPTEIAAINFKVFPNPTTDILTVEINETTDSDLVINIFDLTGKAISKDDFSVTVNTQFSKEFNLENIPTGSYVVEVINGNRRSTQKVVKR